MSSQDFGKVALVLSGGGVKAAAFHTGVCLAIKEKGYRFLSTRDDEATKTLASPKNIRLYVGSSAGSIICSYLASGANLESLIEAFEVAPFFRQFRKSSTKIKPLGYMQLFHLNSANILNMLPNILRHRANVSGGLETTLKKGFKLNGLFTTRGLETYLRENVLQENDFSKLGVELFIVATQLNHSRKVIFGPFDQTSKDKTIQWAHYAKISEAVAASASIPPFFAPYALTDQNGREVILYDGEIRDTMSTHVAVDFGADLVFASCSFHPYHYNPKLGSLHNYGLATIINQAINQLVEQKIEKHLHHYDILQTAFDHIDFYFKKNDLPEAHLNSLKKSLSEKINFRPGVKTVYIHPSPDDYEMFFADHFSLNPKVLSRISRIGLRSALRALREADL